jgi:hypothetical protein
MKLKTEKRIETIVKIVLLLVIITTVVIASDMTGINSISANSFTQNGNTVCDSSDDNCAYFGSGNDTNAGTACSADEYLRGETAKTCVLNTQIVSDGGVITSEVGDISSISTGADAGLTGGCASGTCTLVIDVSDFIGTGLTNPSGETIAVSTTYQGAQAVCGLGTTTYQDAGGLCDDISNVYIDEAGDSASLSGGYLNLDSKTFSYNSVTNHLGIGLEESDAYIEVTGGNITLQEDSSLSTEGNVLADINFGDAYLYYQSRIRIERDAAGSAGTDLPTRIAFHTTNDGSGTPSEKVRLTNEGYLLIGTDKSNTMINVSGVVNTNGIMTSASDEVDIIGDLTVDGGNIFVPTELTILTTSDTNDYWIINSTGTDIEIITAKGGDGDLYFDAGSSDAIYFGAASGNVDTIIPMGSISIGADTVAPSTPSHPGNIEIENGGMCVGLGTSTCDHYPGNLTLLGGIDIDTDGTEDASQARVIIGDTSSSGMSLQVEDGSMCVHTTTCTEPTTDGRLILAGRILAGTLDDESFSYNRFGDDNVTGHGLSTTEDVLIDGDLEVNGVAYLDGGVGDVAEAINSVGSRKYTECEGIPSCLLEKSKDNLDYGDVVCMDKKIPETITKCTDANSEYVLGVISNTTKAQLGSETGYPIAIAGIVNTKVNNENGNIRPGDLLVSASRDGYAMKNNNAKSNTILGRAFESCTAKECNIKMIISLS